MGMHPATNWLSWLIEIYFSCAIFLALCFVFGPIDPRLDKVIFRRFSDQLSLLPLSLNQKICLLR
jgi:hypothetical protein